MSTGLLFDCDETVARAAFSIYGIKPFKFDRALGLIGKDAKLCGAIVFTGYNGYNVEVSYYGKNTVTVGISRLLSRFIIQTFNPSRVTVVTSKRNRFLIRGLQKFGFKVEGMQRCYYGVKDIQRNTGVRFVLFREGLERIAKVDKPTEVATC